MAARLLVALALPLCCCFTCAVSPDGARFFSSDDYGLVTVATVNESGGGPTSLFSGGSRGERRTWREESGAESRVRVGGIDIRGPIDSSTRAGERGFVLGMAARTWAQAESIARMFSFAGLRERQRAGVERARVRAEGAEALERARAARAARGAR